MKRVKIPIHSEREVRRLDGKDEVTEFDKAHCLISYNRDGGADPLRIVFRGQQSRSPEEKVVSEFSSSSLEKPSILISAAAVEE